MFAICMVFLIKYLKKIVLCGTNEANCGFIWWVVDIIIVFFFFFTDNNFVLAYCSCYDNMVLRNQLSLTLSLSPSYCLHSFEQLTCYSFWKFLSTILSPKIGLKLRFCISYLELPLSLRGLHFYFYTFLLNV